MMKIRLKLIPLLAVMLFIFEGFISFENPRSEYVIPATIDSFSIANGKIVFSENCSGCHGQKAEGSYGPNLTDNYYLHGHHYHNMMHVIKHGIEAKGMSAFGHQLSHSQIRDVAHYVISLKGSNPPGAKAPQGKICK